MPTKQNLYKIINKVVNLSFVLLAIASIPLNIVIYFALQNSNNLWVQYAPPIFSMFIICIALLHNKIKVKIKIWFFITLLLLVGIYCLLLGLIDVAGLWFLMVLVFVILIVPKKQAIMILITTITLSIMAGTLLIVGRTSIPLKYDFYNCLVYCVLVRLLHYIIISIILFYFVNAISSHLKDTIKNLQKEISDKKALENKIVDSVLQAEEKERARISRELHDGLGPVFSTAKLYFQAYTDTSDMTTRNEIKNKLENIFDNAISTISELSRLLSPGELMNHGLIPALSDYIQRINDYGKTKIEFIQKEIPKLEKSIELNIFRIVSELINNSIRHGNANTIKLRIKSKSKQLQIQYNDDGKGFDYNLIKDENNGMGLKNIKNRIQSLNGYFEIKSKPGKGMSAFIEIPI
jgi:signal transduction histidine kinase